MTSRVYRRPWHNIDPLRLWPFSGCERTQSGAGGRSGCPGLPAGMTEAAVASTANRRCSGVRGCSVALAQFLSHDRPEGESSCGAVPRYLSWLEVFRSCIEPALPRVRPPSTSQSRQIQSHLGRAELGERRRQLVRGLCSQVGRRKSHLVHVTIARFVIVCLSCSTTSFLVWCKYRIACGRLL